MIYKSFQRATLALMLALSNWSVGETLEGAVYKAIGSNPEVLRAKASWEAERASINEARGDYLPQLDVLAGWGREYTSNSTTPAGQNRTELDRQEAGVNFRQLIYDGWKTPNEVDRREYASEAARYEYVAVSEGAAYSAIEAYRNVLRQQRVLALARENLRSHERIYESIKLRANRGASSSSELMQAEGRLAVAQASVLSSVNNLQDAQAAYIRVIGEAPDSLEAQVAPLELLPSTVDSALSVAVAEHPRMKAAEFDVQEAEFAHRSLKGDFLPEFAFEVERTWNRNIDGIEGRNDDLTAMVRMRMNVLNGGSDKARRLVTANEREVAREIRANTHRQVMEEVHLAWSAYSALDAQIPHLVAHEKKVREVVTAYNKQFRIGKRSLLDVLDTEVEVFSAATRRVNAEIDRDISVYRILRSMGGLLTAMQVPSSALDGEVSESGQTSVGNEQSSDSSDVSGDWSW